MTSEIITFKAFAHVMAEGSKSAWTDNAVILIKHPDGIRLEAVERISDVVAVLTAKNGNGYLNIPSAGKKYPLKGGLVRLPKIGEISVSTGLFASLLIGRPAVQGPAQVSESFHTDKGSYFVSSAFEDIEMSSTEAMPVVYTKYESADKKRVAIEADFDDFAKIGGKKFPRHVVIRFEHPKLVIDIRYKDIQADVNLPWGMFE